MISENRDGSSSSFVILCFIRVQKVHHQVSVESHGHDYGYYVVFIISHGGLNFYAYALIVMF